MTGAVRKQGDDQTRARPTAAALTAANINAGTGLATDYLNHFNDALMLLESVADRLDDMAEFMSWRPKSYVAHFRASQLAARDLAIAAYETADSATRAEFDHITVAMTTILIDVAGAMRRIRHESGRARLAADAAAKLRPMVVAAGGIINGNSAQPDRSDINTTADLPV